jgi:hypothetical protein
MLITALILNLLLPVAVIIVILRQHRSENVLYDEADKMVLVSNRTKPNTEIWRSADNLSRIIQLDYGHFVVQFYFTESPETQWRDYQELSGIPELKGYLYGHH